MLAIGCYAALDEVGLNCPADLSVIGFNDMPFIDRLRPPLTTIRFPHYQVGTEAAQLLLERIAGAHRAGQGPLPGARAGGTRLDRPAGRRRGYPARRGPGLADQPSGPAH